jgi:two-component system, LytTR family, sensor kinase
MSNPTPMVATGKQSRRWIWVAALWCAGALFDASQNVLIMHKEGHHQSPVPLFLTELALWIPWALATPFISYLARRHRLVRGAITPSLTIHLGTFVALCTIAEAWSAGLQVLFNPWGNRRWPTFVDTWTTSLLYQVLTFAVVYALIITVTLMLDSRERMTRQVAETARLNEELSKAQLAALRRQMEPHFLYNSLNSIAGLVRDQRTEAAVSMIVGLSEFLRRVSDDSQSTQVALGEEVAYLQRYVDIQKVRFGERLQVTLDIPTELMRALVPNLLLQPLVENAIKHSIAKRVAGGSVRVAGTRHEDNLRLTVYNDDPSLPADWQALQTGVGIKNLRTRLQILHGAESQIQLRRAEPAGVEVIVTLPFREA